MCSKSTCISLTAWRRMKPLSSGWGSKPTWNASHLPSIHIKGVLQPSYAVDGDMDASSCRSHHTCWSRFEKSDQIPRSLLGAKWSICAVVEAPNPHGMVLTSTPDNIWKVIDNLHMLWMGIWMHHHAVPTTRTVGLIWVPCTSANCAGRLAERIECWLLPSKRTCE